MNILPVLAVGLWLGFMYVWIDALLGIVRIPVSAFRRGEPAKAFWVVVIVLTGLVGIIVWNYWGHARAVGPVTPGSSRRIVPRGTAPASPRSARSARPDR